MNRCSVLAAVMIALTCNADGRDYVLTIGGGYAPEGNQVSLEKNVLLFQRLVKQSLEVPARNDIYFADGHAAAKDLLVHDLSTVPPANRLMAQIFGETDSLGLGFRNHVVPNVRDAATPANVRRWFSEVGSKLGEGDRLIIYVTAHGSQARNDGPEYDTSIAMWNRSSLRMKEMANLLDRMDPMADVVTVMVQCYTGGFSHLVYQGGDPKNGVSPQRRTGFFATVHDRPAAGCTPDVNEADYEEYSTFFFAALLGMDRAGNLIDRPDFDQDGQVSMEEAHAYTILNADTIDLPVKSSDEFLSEESKFSDGDDGLLKNDESFSTIFNLATPVQQVLLTRLSKKLNLDGEARIVDAWRQSRNNRRRRRPTSRAANDASEKISSDLLKRWPELENPYNPLVTELLTSRSAEFIAAVESHPRYDAFVAETNASDSAVNPQSRSVQYERFLRVADNVALAENLRRLKWTEKVRQYEAIVSGEQSVLFRQ